MKKLDKLILQSFIGPFILTFLVVVFILLMQHMLKYFDDIIGKGLEWTTIGQLLFYFGIFMMPIAMPLAVLLSSLITFGNLGEHFELTAIKASGVSLVRTLRPIFFFVLVLTGIAFYTNNNLVPNAALEAYSLMYDIKQKKPALEIRAGEFYTGIPEVSIKVARKFADDDAALKDVIIYSHQKNEGNREVTVADSGRMYTILDKQYLTLELFNGYSYTEGTSTEREMTGQSRRAAADKETLSRTRFGKSQVVFDLSSFELNRTDQRWFQSDRLMRNMSQLEEDMDSVNLLVMNNQLNFLLGRPTYFMYYQRKDSVHLSEELLLYRMYRDSIQRAEPESGVSAAKPMETTVVKQPKQSFKLFKQEKSGKPLTTLPALKLIKQSPLRSPRTLSSTVNFDSLLSRPITHTEAQGATNYARQTKTQISTAVEHQKSLMLGTTVFEIQWHKIMSNSVACIMMFFIGAPLGAIIKRGGLGVPFLVSILFFIIFYLLTMQGEKWAKTGAIDAWAGVWAADMILLVIGLFFLRQARRDARLFDSDFYMVVADRIRTRFNKRVG